MQHLVKLITFEEQVVLDPFSGSGSTGIACLINDRKYVGYELEPNYYDISVRRIEELERECMYSLF